MKSREKEAIRVFRHVRDFLKAEPPEVGFGSVSGVVAQLEDAIARLEGYARDQDARSRTAKAATLVKRAQISAIRREFIRPVVSGALTLFPSGNAIPAALQMPKARDSIGLIAAAEAMAQAATPYKEEFLGAGLPADFIDRILKAVATLREHVDARGAEFGRRTASTAGLRKEYRRGREVVRMLDAMVAPRLASNPARFAEWRTISRFARRPVTALVAEPETPAPLPPADETTGIAA